MSGDDNFLARWSRRKVDVRRAEQSLPLTTGVAIEPVPAPFEGDAVNAQHGGEPESQDQPSPSVPTEHREDQEPLPRLEDVTAESDVTAFLRAGVPQALKQAALRRAWSLDPGIRDYVGPAEYAYDFNDPASIPGFGAAPGWDLKTAAEYAQKIVNPSGAGPADDPVQKVPEALAGPELQSVRLNAEARPLQGVAGDPEAVGAVEAIEMQDVPAQGDDKPADSPAPAPQPRHGGAIPR